MRVLMVNKFHYLRGGSETYHFAVGKALEQMGHEVAWFAMEDSKNLPCRQSRYFVSASDYTGKTSPLKKVKDGLSLVYSLEARRKFEGLLKEFRPDVIHLNLVHRQLTFSILDAPYLKEHPVPVVYTAHDYIPICPACTMLDGAGRVCDACLDGRFRHCLERRCVKGSRIKSALAAIEAAFLRARGSYRKIDRIIAPSEFMRKKLLEGGFPAEQVVRMCNFAKDAVLSRAHRDEDRTDHERPYLLFFGRLSKEKGIDVLVDAFLSIADCISGWRLVIAGEGPEREAIEAQLAGHQEGARVELVGFQRGAALNTFIEGASLAIVSSRCRENMPFSIVEAFAAGTPVIGSRIGGIPELVSDDGTGFLAEPGDAVSLAEAILRGVELCSDAGAYRAMQFCCRSFVLGNCNQSCYIDALVSLYRKLIELKAKERSSSMSAFCSGRPLTRRRDENGGV